MGKQQKPSRNKNIGKTRTKVQVVIVSGQKYKFCGDDEFFKLVSDIKKKFG